MDWKIPVRALQSGSFWWLELISLETVDRSSPIIAILIPIILTCFCVGGGRVMYVHSALMYLKLCSDNSKNNNNNGYLSGNAIL